MPLSCGWNDMNAAFMPLKSPPGRDRAVTGVDESLCGTTGTAARRPRPLMIKISEVTVRWNSINVASTS
jgi:hypothetical protein